MKIKKQSFQIEKESKKRQIARIKDGCDAILKWETAVFKDAEVMRYMPNVVMQMLSKGKEKTAKTIIDRLGAGLLSSEKQIRSATSKALFTIIDNLASENRIETLHRLLDEITGLAIIEGVSNPAFKKICDYLNEIKKVYAKNKRFFEYNFILETFQPAQNKQVPTEQNDIDMTPHTRTSITTNEILSPLLEEVQSDKREKPDQVMPLLSQMGGASVEPLLTILEDSEDRSVRAKIIQIISDIGPEAISDVTLRMNSAESWFYLRNLAKILGKIGDESTLKYLTRLLHHQEYPVRREALNSLYVVGGSQREGIFILLLSTADDRLKTDVVGMLGALKRDDAVPHLVNLLETETFVSPKEKIELGVKICIVLGSIGSEDAVPTLRSILEHKRSLIWKSKYNKRVQSAAKNAVDMIQWKTIN